MKDNNISFNYVLFNQITEGLKILNKSDLPTSYIIKHIDTLPILKGDFNICDSTFKAYTLFIDTNLVVSK